MMGAGNASSSLYQCNPNEPTGGGSKKQGISPRVGLNHWSNREIQTQSNGFGRFKLVFQNQLGGVGAGNSMFGGQWNRADGINKKDTLKDKLFNTLLNNKYFKDDLITFEQFNNFQNYYGKITGNTKTQEQIIKVFNFLISIVGVDNKLSKQKMINVDLEKIKKKLLSKLGIVGYNQKKCLKSCGDGSENNSWQCGCVSWGWLGIMCSGFCDGGICEEAVFSCLYQ